MHWSYERWTAWIGRHYRAIVAGSAVLGLVSALSLTRLRLDIDVLNMLPRGTPAFDDFKAFVGEFGQLDELFVVVDEAPPATLHRFADALALRLAALDSIEQVHSRIDPQQMLDGMLGKYLFNYIPEAAYGEVAERLTPAAIDAQVEADRAILSAPFDLSTTRAVTDDPLGFRRLAGQHLSNAYAGVAPVLDSGYFTSRDGGAVLLFVRPKGSAFDAVFTEQLLEQVPTAVTEARKDIGGEPVRVRYSGSYAFAHEDAATFKADVARYTVLALLGVLAIVYLGYGNLGILPFITYPLIVTTLITFALSLFMYAELNAVSLSFAAILYGLSIDSGIHFYTRLLAERRRSGGDMTAAVTATLATLGRANIAVSATTAAGFAIIGFSVLSAVRELGILTAVGMIVNIVEFFVLYPALGFMLGRSKGRELRSVDAVWLARWSAAAERHARPTCIAMLIATVVLGATAMQVRLDPNLDHLRPAQSEAFRIQEEVAERFTSQHGTGAVLVRRPDLESALVDNERVGALLRSYRDRGLVRSVQSIDAMLPSQQTQQARLQRYSELPRAAAVDTLRESLQRHGFKPGPFEPFLQTFAVPRTAVVRLGDPALRGLDFVTSRHVRQREGEAVVATYLEAADGVAWPALAAQLRTDLPGMPLLIAARPLLEDELGRVLRRELLFFLVLGLLGNLALLVVILREWMVSLAVVAPVVIVILALFAGMWVLGIPVDPVNLIVPPLIVGIGVDAGVYLAAATRRFGSIAAGMRTIGRAMMVSALTTIAGFGFLALSAYPPLAMLGKLMGIGLFLSLVATIFLVPALLTSRVPSPSGRGTG